MKKVLLTFTILLCAACRFIAFAQTVCAPIKVYSDRTSGAEYFVGDTIIIAHFVSVWDSPDAVAPFTYTPISIPAGSSLSSDGILTAKALIPFGFHYKIRVTDARGCSDTYEYDITVLCDPLNYFQADITGVRKGQFFSAAVPAFRAIAGPYHDFYAIDALPAGLSVSPGGIISGTPSVYGVFDFVRIGYTGLSGCPYNTWLKLTIENSVPVKPLYIKTRCAESDSLRNWTLVNPNAFDIQVTAMELYYQSHSQYFIAHPGNNFFTTWNVGGPNTIRVQYADQLGNTKTLIQAANNELCATPSCITASSVDFYHQGLQKNGQHIPTYYQDAQTMLGEPDANDAASGSGKAFSLGYDGFAILALNANLVDGPGMDLTVYEYSDGNPSFSVYPERAEVFASANGTTWVSLGLTSPGTNCQQKLDTDFDLAGKLPWCRYIKILDVTNRHAKVLNASTCSATSANAFNDVSNGFDVDAITCKNTAALASGQQGSPSAVDFKEKREYSVLYPNPTAGTLTIDLSREKEFSFPENGAVDVQLLDMNGSAVYQKGHTLDDEWKTQCDVTSLIPGVFIARINTGKASHYYRFVKF